MSERVLQVLRGQFGSAIIETHAFLGDDTAIVDPKRWKEICTFLRNDPQMAFDMMVDLCAVDYAGFDSKQVGAPSAPGESDARFEVVLHLYSTSQRHRVRLKARVGDAEGDDAQIDSVTDVWPGVNWFEREAYDMLGITFLGHPDLRRILMYPEFTGHPLRKDYPADKTQPLVPYRTEEEAGLPLDKQAPFRKDEGMPFGRKVWGVERGES